MWAGWGVWRCPPLQAAVGWEILADDVELHAGLLADEEVLNIICEVDHLFGCSRRTRDVEESGSGQLEARVIGYRYFQLGFEELLLLDAHPLSNMCGGHAHLGASVV